MSGKIEQLEGQPNIKDIFNKHVKTQVKMATFKPSTQGQKTLVQPGYLPLSTSASAKKQTLPSTERPSPKKQQTTATSTTTMNNNISNEHPKIAKEISFKGFSAEFVHFGETIKELLQPMKDDIQRLVEAQNINTMTTEICEEVKQDQAELKIRVEKVETENTELKNRLKHLENTMLQNNLIIHSIKEDEWELDETRKEKIHKAIASTVDAPDYRKCIKIAKSIAIVKPA